jgi:hypothetical protein
MLSPKKEGSARCEIDYLYPSCMTYAITVAYGLIYATNKLNESESILESVFLRKL